MPRSVLFCAAALSAATLSACGDSGSPSTEAQVNFNVATQPAAAGSASAIAAATVGTPETFTDASNTLVINQVQLVVREIELKRVGA